MPDPFSQVQSGGRLKIPAQAWNWLIRFAVRNAGLGAPIANQPSAIPGEGHGPPAFIWVKITGNSSISANQWSYTGTRVIPWVMSGMVEWLSWTPTQTIAGIVNSIDANNSASGIQGDGINVSNLGNFTLQPLGNGAVVPVNVVYTNTGPAYIITVPVQPDGTCTS